MNRTGAEKIIPVEIELFRLRPHEALVEMIDKEPITRERIGSNGK